MTSCIRALALALSAFGALATTVRGDDAPSVDAKTAFARLKSLAGEWKAEVGNDRPPAKIVYRVTANGSVVMETLYTGTAHEMISMYHVDGADLKLTHYCSAGNQPRLTLDRKGSTAGKLKFDFEGGTNLDPAKDSHMHAGRITIKDDKHVESEWDGFQGGKKVGTQKFVLTRE
jgi:hypothetical protein